MSLKYEIPQMLKQGGGAIVNNASMFGLVSFSNVSIYCASKHGVVGLTKAVALEQAKTGIRINAVCPGVIQTDMADRAFNDEVKAMMAKAHPMGRIGTSEEIADAVLWLCSDGATFVTGQAITIDGGYTAQ